MGSLVVIVFHVLRDRSPEVSLAEDHHAIQALGLDREHESLREGVQIRASRRQPDRGDTGTLQQLAEASCEQGISVVDEEPLGSQEPIEVIDQVPRDLLHPQPVRDRSDPRDLDLSRRQIDHEALPTQAGTLNDAFGGVYCNGADRA